MLAIFDHQPVRRGHKYLSRRPGYTWLCEFRSPLIAFIFCGSLMLSARGISQSCPSVNMTALGTGTMLPGFLMTRCSSQLETPRLRSQLAHLCTPAWEIIIVIINSVDFEKRHVLGPPAWIPYILLFGTIAQFSS